MDVIAGEMATKRDIEAVKLDTENVLCAEPQPSWALRICVLELKHDIEILRAELKYDIKMLCAELKHEIAELRQDMKEQELRLTINFGAMLAIAVVVMVILLVEASLKAMIIVWTTASVAWMERSLRSVIQVLPGRNDDLSLFEANGLSNCHDSNQTLYSVWYSDKIEVGFYIDLGTETPRIYNYQ